MKRNYATRRTLVILLIVSVFVMPLYGCNSRLHKRYFKVEISNGIKSFDDGSLKYGYGIPILTLKGTHYEAGLEYGVLMKDKLQDVYGQLGEIEKSILRKFPVYMKFFVKVLVFVKLFLIKSRLSKNYIDELRGVSDGSGIPFNQLLIASFIPELFTFSCTSFVKDVNGRLIHGRNLDYYFPLIGENPIIVRYLLNGEIPYTTVGCVGYLGAFTGMNDKGITITVNAAPTVNSDDGDGKPITFEVRDLLAHSRTLTDISANLRDYHSIKGWMLTIGSSDEKKALVYNIAETHLKPTFMDGREIFVTNTFIDKEFAHKYMSLHEAGSESSVSRYVMAENLIKKVDSIQTAVDFLSNANFFGYKNIIGAGDVTLNNEGTLQSVIMDPSNLTIYFSSSGMYAGFFDFYKFDVKRSEISLYKEKNTLTSLNSFEQFSTWFKKAELLYLEGNFKGAYKFTRGQNISYLMQLEGMFDVMRRLKLLNKEGALLLNSAERLIDKYSDYALPYLIEAKIFFAKKDFKNAAFYGEKALEARIIFPYMKADALSVVAESYYKLHKMGLAKQYARKSKNMIEQYAIGTNEKEILSKINRILSD